MKAIEEQLTIPELEFRLAEARRKREALGKEVRRLRDRVDSLKRAEKRNSMEKPF